MPTNLLPKRPTPPRSAKARSVSAPARRVLIKAGRITIRAELLDTATADRVWAALPLYSTAERWGQSIHFETPVETGRDRTARVLATPGEIYFWVEDDRILIVFGPTPISRPGEVRLPRPCNLWAKALDDVTPLKDVAPGEKVSVTVA
ncbi:cyclophilin-like family protein [Hyphomicrobium sp.]|uniref:cyclophilin-like family protein n=1 Tax=Hyphomicrobium sp. TaxID=82 RepID=UPI002E3280FF|nr:cyclophilin-like family protein [Hyphomicrobium sp.]HEX2843156.1 cyclophilin-like family protein [Hyphomicrobium sp.]